MKKISLILIALLLVLSLPAKDFSSELNRTAYIPTSMTFRAMGESGRAIALPEDGFSVNPAALASDGFELILPSFEAAVTNVNALLNSDIKGVLNKDTTAMMDMLSLLSGSSYFIDGKISSSLIIKGFGVSFSLKSGLYTSGESISAYVTVPIEGVLSLGYAHEFDLNNSYKLSIGGVLHTNLRYYIKPVDVTTFVDVATGDEKLDLSFIKESNLTLDLGATLKMPYGFSSALTIDHITLKNLKGNLKYDLSLSTSLGWSYKYGPLRLSLAMDLVDITRIQINNALYHLNLGGYIGLWNNLGLYGGLKGGYPSFGLKLKLLFMESYITYTINEYSEFVGYNPKDTLSFSFRLFF